MAIIYEKPGAGFWVVLTGFAHLMFSIFVVARDLGMVVLYETPINRLK